MRQFLLTLTFVVLLTLLFPTLVHATGVSGTGGPLHYSMMTY